MLMSIYQSLLHLIKKLSNSSSSDLENQSDEKSVSTLVVNMVHKLIAPTITLLSSALAYWTASRLRELGLLEESMLRNVIDILFNM